MAKLKCVCSQLIKICNASTLNVSSLRLFQILTGKYYSKINLLSYKTLEFTSKKYGMLKTLRKFNIKWTNQMINKEDTNKMIFKFLNHAQSIKRQTNKESQNSNKRSDLLKES